MCGRTGRLTVSELKEEVRGLILRDRLHTPAEVPHKLSKTYAPAQTRKCLFFSFFLLTVSSLTFCFLSQSPSASAVAVETSPLRQVLSDSEDEFSPTPSLGDVSSDDLDTSWFGESG